MSTVTEEPPVAEIAATPSRLHRLSVAQYDEMARVGILTKYDRVELIEGYLVDKMTKHEPHVTTTWLIDRALGRVLADGWFAVTESPIVLARSEPEPDVLIVRGDILDYARRKPRPADVGLIVEVSDSSYAEDRALRRIYAEAGLSNYWIANIPAGRIEVYTDPDQAGLASDYRIRVDIPRGQVVALLLDGREVAQLAVDDLLCPAE